MERPICTEHAPRSPADLLNPKTYKGTVQAHPAGYYAALIVGTGRSHYQPCTGQITTRDEREVSGVTFGEDDQLNGVYVVAPGTPVYDVVLGEILAFFKAHGVKLDLLDGRGSPDDDGGGGQFFFFCGCFLSMHTGTWEAAAVGVGSSGQEKHSCARKGGLGCEIQSFIFDTLPRVGVGQGFGYGRDAMAPLIGVAFRQVMGLEYLNVRAREFVQVNKNSGCVGLDGEADVCESLGQPKLQVITWLLVERCWFAEEWQSLAVWCVIESPEVMRLPDYPVGTGSSG